MRKITLFLMLLVTVVTTAFTQTPVLTYENITAPQELSAEDASIISKMSAMTIIADVEITNSSDVSLLFTAVADYTSSSTANNSIWGLGFGGNQMRYIVGARSGGWYSQGAVNTNSTKIIYTYDGSKINFYVDGATNVGNVGSTKALNTFTGDNAKFYLGGMIYNTDTQYGTFNGTIKTVNIYDKALSESEIAALYPVELPEGVIYNIDEISNNKVYNLITTRGWLIYNEANAGVVASTASYGTFTTGEDVEACQWAIYKSEKNKYYLYNIAAGKFVGANSEEGGRFPFVAEVTNDIQVVKSTTGTEYALVFSTDNYGAINHFNHTTVPGVANWRGNDSQGGLRALSDGGSAHKVVEVADIAPATLNAIAEAVAKFETDNTSAVAKLDVALANAQTLFAQITVGTGMGEYTATDADYETKFNSIVAFRQAIQSTNTPTPAEVEAKIDEVDALIASFKLNLPEAGKYYRIMAVDGWNDDARYLGAQNSTAKDGRAEFVAEADDNTVFYFDGEYLKSNATGYYLVSNSSFLGYNGEQTEGSVIAFRAASNNLIGAYNISFNGGARWLYCNQNNFTDAGGSTNNANGYCFNIEEVEVVVEPENPTVIENVETEAENAEIYDLTGRKVENITKAGIYIVNGCKVLVK